MKKLTKMKVIGLAALTLFLSCKKGNNEVLINGNAKFNLVNAVEGSTAQDFYQGNTKINATATAYGEASGYLTLKAGSSTVAFKSALDQTVSATSNISINTDANYTVFYVKNENGVGEIAGYPETTASPPSGKAGVRFINLSTALASSITVSFGSGEPLTSALDFGISTNYAAIDPSIDLKFSNVGSTLPTVIPGSTFQAGKIYTVWFDAENATTFRYHIVTQN